MESVGEGVTDFQAGDAVLPFVQGQCGNCSYCKNERINSCKELPIAMVSPHLPKADAPHFSTEDGRVISILMGASTFSEYTVVHKTNLAKINPKAPLETICVLSCGVGTGMYSLHLQPQDILSCLQLASRSAHRSPFADV